MLIPQKQVLLLLLDLREPEVERPAAKPSLRVNSFYTNLQVRISFQGGEDGFFVVVVV